MNQWTNQKLATKGKKKVAQEQFMVSRNRRLMIEIVLRGVDKFRGANKKCKHVGDLNVMELPFEREEDQEGI